MGNIKVLELENWVLYDGEDDIFDPLLGSSRYPQTKPIFLRNGWYLNGDRCWIEKDGLAYEAHTEDFKFWLNALTASELPPEKVSALRAICSVKLATKKQIEILYSRKNWEEVRAVERETRKSFLNI